MPIFRRESSFSSNAGFRPNRRRGIVLAPLLIAAAILLFQYLSASSYVNPETGQQVRVALSPEQEERLGLQSFSEVLSQSEVVESGPEFEMVRRVAQKLVEQVDLKSREFNWAVSLVESEQVNAFCLPGGKIVVFTGILPVAESEAGLATVMGHEIAHATARHGAQRLFQQQLVQTALSGVNGSLVDLDPSQRQTFMALFGAGVQYGLILPYGRDHELEADEIGLRYMARAGYDPREAIGFWERMSKAGGGSAPEWASTHPAHGSRIERIKKLISDGKLAQRPLIESTQSASSDYR
jgi:predicted Zn-dependent protease